MTEQAAGLPGGPQAPVPRSRLAADDGSAGTDAGSARDSLEAWVDAVFAEGGVLSRTTEQFQPRAAQTEMALAVAQTIETGGALVVEAGTGVGKTFAYLVPALLSGERVLLSTATKTLQDQLFGRDLPRLVDALGLALRIALLKGRASYLCSHRLALAREDAHLPDRRAVQTLARIETWAQSTRTGDLAEISGLDERSPVIPLVTSTRENCLGSQCPGFKGCHVHAARREALAADVVVVNHHLFFADLAVRESGMAELLPTVRVAIFDEAHQLNETGVQFLGVQLATSQLLDFCRDLLGAGLQLARGLVDWQQVASQVERAARDLRLAAGRGAGGGRLAWNTATPEGTDTQAWDDGLRDVAEACLAAMDALDTVSEIAPDFQRLHERAAALAQRAGRFAGPCETGSVRWIDLGQQLRMVESPLDIADAVRSKMLGRAGRSDVSDSAPGRRTASGNLDAGLDDWLSAQESGDYDGLPWSDDDQSTPAHSKSPEVVQEADRPDHESYEPEPSRRAWIFTSATLGDDPRLRWFTEPCGLEDAQVLRVGSPFNYGRQAGLYLPPGLPRPSDPTHSNRVADIAAQGAQRLGGRTLVLTTTLRALRAIGEALQVHFEGNSSVEVLVQGQWPKRRLMERFREGQAHGQPGCVLVASASFWEGVDVPGDALQLVVIDKLPFPPPGDPLVEARSRRLEQQGRSAFGDYSLPEAAVALKQGAGRLIRSEQDRGVLVVCDNRLLTMGYGRRLLAALPPMRRLATPADYAAALTDLMAQGTPDSGA